MQIILNLIGHDERQQSEIYSVFSRVLDKLEQDGFDIKWSRKGITEQIAKLAVITDEEEYDEETKSIVITKDVRTMDTVFVGYMFCTSYKDMYPLSAKRLLDNYDGLIYGKNKELLTKLYKEEFEEKKKK